MSLYTEEQTLNYFDDVPDEILYEILSILPRFDLWELAEVSQKFQRVCGDERLWKSVSLTEQKIEFSKLEMLLTSSFPIKELDLTRSCMSDARHYRGAVSFYFRKTLEKLDLTGFGKISKWKSNWYDYEDVLFILQRCTTKELILDSRKLHLNSRMMEVISRHKDLEVLSMEWTWLDRVDVYDIRRLFNGCKHLRELSLAACDLSSHLLRVICEYIPETLEKLVLVGADYIELSHRSLQNQGLAMIVESHGILFHRARNLKYFGTSLRFLKMPAIMYQIIQHHSLETLRLSDYDFSNPDLISVAEQMAPVLKRIDVVSPEERMTEEKRASLIQLENLTETLTRIDVKVRFIEMGQN